MSLTFVNIHGQPVNTESRIERKPRPVKQVDAQHKGWRVVGYSPANIAKARAEQDKLVSEWGELSESDRADVIKKGGGKEPQPFCVERFMQKNKPTAVNRRPYEIPQAAHDCKALAEKAGWLDVQIVEMKRE